MRPELKEYKFDSMLLSTFASAAKLKNGSDKEYRTMLKYIPYFNGTVTTVLDTGEPGRLFIECISKYLENYITAREKGFHNAITTFCFSPGILYAMDVFPICLEVLSVAQTFAYKRGTAEFLDFCNEVGYTETSCSSQRGTLGAFLAGVGADVDMVLTDTPGVCDTNANAFAFAAAYLKIPFFSLDMPPVLVDVRTDQYHNADFRALIAFLEEHTGRKLDLDRLREVLKEIEKQEELVAELEDLARIVPNPLPVTFNLMVYATRFLFSGMKECTAVLESMIRIASDNASRGVSGLSGGVEKLRTFFCYIDHYTNSLKLWDFLDKNGICYQGNILSRSWASTAPHVKEYRTEAAAYTFDYGGLDAMIRTMADHNSRMPMIKSIRGPYDAPDMWLQDTLSLAKMYSADCIIYNGTPGCRNTWGMVKLLARDTEKAGIPTFIMYGDAFDDRVESWEASRDRLEEFLRVRRLLV